MPLLALFARLRVYAIAYSFRRTDIRDSKRRCSEILNITTIECVRNNL